MGRLRPHAGAALLLKRLFSDTSGLHLHLHKSRGQHILTNPRVLDAIVRSSGIGPDDAVLEVGPGTGNLTVRLLHQARSVVAVEIDPRMVDVLTTRVRDLGLEDKLTVIQQDALKTKFPKFDLCISNIPYGISSPLLAKLFFGPDKYNFRSATLLLQKEFARRLLADPGDSEFNRLAMNIKLMAKVNFLMGVSKRDFVPNPRVDSSVVMITPRSEIPNVDLDEWWALTQLCFGKKNKTLGAIFRQKKKLMDLMCRFHENAGKLQKDDEMDEVEENNVSEVGLFKEKIIRILKEGGFEERRPSKLSHDELLRLLFLFNHAGIHFQK